MKKIIEKLKHLSKKKVVFIAIAVVLVGGLVIYKTSRSKTQTVQYQTATVEKGDLIVSTSATGTISSGNSTDISTKASGVVKKVYVSNGDEVTKGQKIADLTLDEYGQERQASAYSAYVDAQVAAKTAEAAKDGADIAMWEAREAIFDAIDDIDYKNDNTVNPATKETYTDSEKMIVDKTLTKNQKTFAAAELKYKTADAAIAKAKATVVSAWKDYQQAAATIVAPSAGTVNNLALSIGTVITTTTSTSSTTNTVTAQQIGKINDNSGSFQASVSLSEIYIVGIKANQKVTLTLDAYTDKTFTGKVLSVDTDGSVSSGVTTYPVTILLDPTTVEIYPNMAVSVDIIKEVKTNVIKIPTTAITTNNDQSSVEVMKDGQPTTVTVELGISNDNSTEITSGLNEGDIIITSTTTSQQSTLNTSEASPFSGISRSTGSSNRNSVVIQGGGPPGF